MKFVYVIFSVIMVFCFLHLGWGWTGSWGAGSCTRVMDGDTYIFDGQYSQRMADIDAPESGEDGYTFAKTKLKEMIEGKTVYQNIGAKDKYGRWVCVTFVRWNLTHFVNVNEYMLVNGYAVEWDYPNEFSPSEWTLYTSKDPNGFPVIPEFPIAGYLFLALLITSLITLSRKNRKFNE